MLAVQADDLLEEAGLREVDIIFQIIQYLHTVKMSFMPEIAAESEASQSFLSCLLEMANCPQRSKLISSQKICEPFKFATATCNQRMIRKKLEYSLAMELVIA